MKRRATARNGAHEPGGRMFSIHRRDVRRFLIDNAGAVDLRRADAVWLIELLATGGGE